MDDKSNNSSGNNPNISNVLDRAETNTMSSMNDDSTMMTVHYNSLSRGEQDMIVNVTREYPFDYATIMFGHIMPFVLVVTLITNTLVVMVLAQRHMRTPTNIVLFAMAIVDLMTLLSPSPWYFYIYTLGYHDKFLYPPSACYAHHIMTDVVPVYFHTSSIWLALLLASQRYIYVCHPTLASTWCTVPRVKRAIKYILVTAFLHQLTRFFDNTFKTVLIQYEQGTAYACRNEIAEWVNSIDIAMYYTTYYTFRIFFVFIIPCIALIALNCLLFRALRRAETKRTELLNPRFRSSGMAGINNQTSRCSVSADVAGGGGRSSINQITTGGHLFMNSNQKSSNPASSATEGTTNTKAQMKKLKIRSDITAKVKKRKFFINSFRSKIESSSLFNKAHTEEVDGHDNKLICRENKNPSSKEKQQTSDMKYLTAGSATNTCNASSKIGETKLDNKRNSVSSIVPQENYDKNNKISTPHKDRGIAKQISEESNHSCSTSANPSSLHHHHRPLLLFRHRQRHSSSNEGSAEETNWATTRDECGFVCSHCAECEEHNQTIIGCRRCSASGNDGTTNEQRNQHQPISQCSSLLAGATNTTTNEDVSSCLATQNASSSMFVVNDGTLEATEVASMRGDEVLEIEDQEDSISLERHVFIGQATVEGRGEHNEKSDEKQPSHCSKRDSDGKIVIKSGSDDSRLACGCRMSKMRRNSEACRDCCSSNRYQKETRRFINSDLMSNNAEHKDPLGDNCSSSEPCINRKKSKKNKQAFSCDKGDEVVDLKENLDEKDKIQIYNNINNKKDGDDSRTKLAALPDSESDSEANEMAQKNGKIPNRNTSCNFQNACGIASGAQTATNTNTNTATTTLYSNTNSAGSLLQVQNSQKQSPGIPATQSSSVSSQPQQLTTISNRSISLRGRGSSNPPALIVSGSFMPPTTTTTTTASLRTMDSNRTTLMLIVVVTVFLMVEVPVAIVTILHVVLNSFEIFKDVEFVSFSYIKLFTNFFIMISYSVNFTIYCSMSKKFRETFRELFLCGKRAKRKRAKRMLYQQQQHSQTNNQHHFNGQSHSQINTNNNDNNNNIMGATSIQNDSTAVFSALNQTTTTAPLLSANNIMRQYPYRKPAGQQQQECEL